MMLNLFFEFQEKVVVLGIVLRFFNVFTSKILNHFHICPIGDQCEMRFLSDNFSQESETFKSLCLLIVGYRFLFEKLAVGFEACFVRSAMPDSCDHINANYSNVIRTLLGTRMTLMCGRVQSSEIKLKANG